MTSLITYGIQLLLSLTGNLFGLIKDKTAENARQNAATVIGMSQQADARRAEEKLIENAAKAAPINPTLTNNNLEETEVIDPAKLYELDKKEVKQ
jgi:uncharacterized membrane protein YcjF (UPF0283 family)